MTLAALTPTEREALLRELTELECRVTETSGSASSLMRLRELAFVSIQRTFLPQGVHLDALSPSRLLILGERGVGKSALFRLLIEAQGAAALRLLFENPTLAATKYVEGFTETSMAHPPVTMVDDFALKVSGAAAVRAFWMAHLLRRLATMGLVELDDANRWLFDDSASAFAWMRQAPGQVAQLQHLMDGVERTLVREGRSICVLYDQLDRVGAHHPEVQRRAVGSLLSLWLSLAQRYRALRGKIFLRDDVFERTELDFPDVSKLRRGQSVTLRWSENDLFRVALRHIVALCPRLGPRLQEVPALAASLRSVPDFGEIPGPMPDPVQREFLGALVGEVIGEGLLQTYSNRWLLGAILDSRRQGTPRVMLSALGGAARAALESDSAMSDARLLTEEELREGVRRAGLDRLRELRETHPVVRRLDNVERRQVPVSAAVMDRWLAAPVEGEPPELAQLDGAAVRKRLLRLGLLSQPDATARCDLPDLYLYVLRASRVVNAGRDEERSAFGAPAPLDVSCARVVLWEETPTALLEAPVGARHGDVWALLAYLANAIKQQVASASPWEVTVSIFTRFDETQQFVGRVSLVPLGGQAAEEGLALLQDAVATLEGAA